MSAPQPSSKPQATREQIQKIIAAHGIDRSKHPCVLVCIRGYYLDTMGEKGKNDRGIYDDAAFWDTPDVFASYNANADPSAYRRGSGTGAKKGMASLKTGVWLYQKGLHKGYQAFVQADKVTVIRDGEPDYPDTGWFGINIHRGGVNGTSSEGCQTIPVAQWDSFKQLGYAELDRNKQKAFPYILVDELERRAMVFEGDAGGPIGFGADLAPAITLIKEFEGLYLKAYVDPVGVWTIGWGTTIYPNGVRVKSGDTITRAQAEEYLLHDIGTSHVRAVQKLVTVPINANQTCALVSFAYNVGNGALAGSTLLKKLNARAPKLEVAEEFARWNKGTDPRTGKKIVLAGLTRRRAMEAKLFLS